MSNKILDLISLLSENEPIMASIGEYLIKPVDFFILSMVCKLFKNILQNNRFWSETFFTLVLSNLDKFSINIKMENFTSLLNIPDSKGSEYGWNITLNLKQVVHQFVRSAPDSLDYIQKCLICNLWRPIDEMPTTCQYHANLNCCQLFHCTKENKKICFLCQTKKCHVCEEIFCLTCQKDEIFDCSDVDLSVCKKCNTKCNKCIKYVSSVFKCSIEYCKQKLCTKCIYKCHQCKKRFCKFHSENECKSHGEERLCKNCQSFCKYCRYFNCSSSLTTCQICNSDFCFECTQTCKKCKLKFCKNHKFSTCCIHGESEILCQTCMKKCIACNKSTCVDKKQCDKCFKPVCRDTCIIKCHLCNKSVCKDHELTMCEYHNELMCFSCTSNRFKCKSCNNFSCQENIKCQECDRMVCLKCVMDCKGCNRKLCKKHKINHNTNSEKLCDKCYQGCARCSSIKSKKELKSCSNCNSLICQEWCTSICSNKNCKKIYCGHYLDNYESYCASKFIKVCAICNKIFCLNCSSFCPGSDVCYNCCSNQRIETTVKGLLTSIKNLPKDDIKRKARIYLQDFSITCQNLRKEIKKIIIKNGYDIEKINLFMDDVLPKIKCLCDPKKVIILQNLLAQSCKPTINL